METAAKKKPNPSSFIKEKNESNKEINCEASSVYNPQINLLVSEERPAM
jgi:hypothetical protein